MEKSEFMAAAARRLTFWGSTIIAVLGVVFAFTEASSNEYTGAGVLLAASALALGILSYTFMRK